MLRVVGLLMEWVGSVECFGGREGCRRSIGRDGFVLPRVKIFGRMIAMPVAKPSCDVVPCVCRIRAVSIALVGSRSREAESDEILADCPIGKGGISSCLCRV